jgi:Amt family ammonium transporter
VHGVCGLFGVLCVGLFADGTYGGGWNGTMQADGRTGSGYYSVYFRRCFKAKRTLALVIDGSAVGVVTLLVWALGFSLLFFKVQKLLMGLRVAPEDELAGLDIPETGVLAYPAFHMAPESGEHVMDYLPDTPSSTRAR